MFYTQERGKECRFKEGPKCHVVIDRGNPSREERTERKKGVSPLEPGTIWKDKMVNSFEISD